MGRTLTSNKALEKKVQEEADKQSRSFSKQVWHIIEKFFEYPPRKLKNGER